MHVRPPTGPAILGIFVVFAGLLAATGLPLAALYEPSPAGAHASVERLDAGQMGWVRSLHAWSADALLVLGLAAGAWVFVERRPLVLDPRRWIGATGVLGLVVAGLLSGGILTWDQQGWESWQHVDSATPFFSTTEPSDAPLGLVFWAHVLVVPVLLAAFFGAAIWNARHGLWTHMRAAAATPVFWAPLVGVAAAAAIWPPSLGPQPIADVATSRPEWPFLWLVPLQEALGVGALWILPGVLVLVLGVPWATRAWTSRARLWVVGLLAAILFGLTLWGLRG